MLVWKRQNHLHVGEPDKMLCIAICLFALSVEAVISTRYGRVMYEVDGRKVPMDVALGRSSMISFPGKSLPPSDCYTPTLNLHDFHRNLVAIKSVDQAACFVKPNPESFQGVKELLKEFEQGRTQPEKMKIESWTKTKQAVSEDKVESSFGRKIANFCSGYKVFILKNQKNYTSFAAFQSATRVDKYCAVGCGVCNLILLDD